jgi:hypothetical protein
MHADPGDIPDHWNETISDGSNEALRQLLDAHRPALWNPDTQLHECIHFWQGLSLPFLYWYSFTAFKMVQRLFVFLSRRFPDLHDWRSPIPGIMNLMSETVYPYWCATGLRLSRQDRGEIAGFRRLPGIRALEETAASVMQWDLSRSGGSRTITGFRLWSLRNASYPEMIDYLAQLVGDEELALAMYLPLCNTSLHTLNPIIGFVTGALQYVERHKGDLFVASSQLRNRLWRLFADIEAAQFALNSGDVKRRLNDLETSIIDLPFYRTSMQGVVNLTFGESGWQHPTLHIPATRWMADAKTRRDMRKLLNDPAAVSKQTLNYVLEEYQPLILVRLALHGRVRVLPVGRVSDLDYVSRVEQVAPGTDGMAAFRDLFTVFGAVRRATNMFYANDVRLCEHAQCPEHKHNYCNSWIFSPKNYRDCTFLDMITYIRDSVHRLEEKSLGKTDRTH